MADKDSPPPAKRPRGDTIQPSSSTPPETGPDDAILTQADVPDILEEIVGAKEKSYIFGLKLKLPLDVVDTIYETYPKQEERLRQVLIEFTKQVEPRPTWRAIVTALRSPVVNLPRLAKIVEAAHFPHHGETDPESSPPVPVGSPFRTQPPPAAMPLTDTPTLPELLRFKIPLLIGKHYSILGPLLLDDDTGAVTSAIVTQFLLDAPAINQDILTKWLRGQGKQPVTWSTLFDVLKEVGLLQLAKRVKKDLVEAEVQELERKNTEWQQKMEKTRQQINKTEGEIEDLWQKIRQEETEKEKFMQTKDKEIAKKKKNLRKLREQEKSSRREIEDQERQLQSSEALVAELKKALEKEDVKILRTKISGPGLQSATANKQTHVTVEVTDSSDRPCLVQQRVTAELISITTPTSPSRKPSVVHAAVATTSPSRYEVSYIAISRGQHKLHVQLNGVEINGSPFTMTVYPDPTQLAKPEKVLEDLTTPYSIAFNSRGEMVITEKLAHQISIFDNKGQRIRRFGSPGDSSENMIHPQGLAIDEEDNIYVSSYNKLQKFNRDDKLIACSRRNFSDPYGVTLHNNEVYVCDCNNHCIQAFDRDLNFVRSIGEYGKGRGQFNTPYDVQFDTDGCMYVAEWGNERVQVLDKDGHFKREFGVEEDGKLLRPSTLKIVDKYIYVSDYSGGCIVVYETSGEYVTKFGGWGLGKGQFIYPYCISSSRDGYIYVCDRENRRVQIF